MENSDLFSILAALVVTGAVGFIAVFLYNSFRISRLFQKGVDLYQARDYDQAEVTFRAVSEQQKSNDVVLILLGNTLIKQGKLTEANQILTDLIDRSPKVADAYLSLANLELKQEQKSQAIVYLQKAQTLLQAQRNPEKAAKIQRLIQELAP